MSDVYSEIAGRIKGFLGNDNSLFVAEVVSCEGSTCTIKEDEFEMSDVRLRVVEDDAEALLLTPKKGSYVLVSDLSNGERRSLAVVGFSEVEKVQITADQIEINGGDNGGLINVKDLVSRLNTIEKKINGLCQALTTWVPVPQDGGSSLKAGITSWAAQQLIQTQASDIEDTKITH